MSVTPNPEQLAAIEAGGRVFVSAGAGTGKTSVLVERFIRAVCEGGLDVDSILVITYTKRAAAELRARIRSALQARGRHELARELDAAWISTIHGFCNRLLKAYPFRAGLDPRFRELDEPQAAVLRGEAFDLALEEFSAREEPERVHLLATYGAAGLRRMLTGVYETLRSAGRPLVLELGDRPQLSERLAEAGEAASALVGSGGATAAQRGNAEGLLELLGGGPRADRLLDLSAFRARGERAASYENARRALEQAALDELAARDRDLLQELLEGFGRAYAAAKERESALDFADLQLLALTWNYRSRPEVLAAVNHLFEDDFGKGYQPLTASGEFPDPVFGYPVELLVTDKASYADTEVHWRRAEAKQIARRVRELVDTGAASPGEIVLLFAAGTDAEWYEEELRALDLPTLRATGRGYFGQQQVVDLLAYLRLLQNRYDDVALLSVLASPLVGVSNDALVLLRRAAGRRPLFVGLERSLPPEIDERDARLMMAFRQRYDRLVNASARLSLERLCEAVVAEHDYDLAVLALWDGRRRYANLRKLARLARSYEELRGPDIEGFVCFVRDQDAVGAKELEAVAEEEDADAVRLLTIHAAKGLEFKVVVVADAGRERAAPASDEILALSDGRFGFRVADPLTSERRGAFDYEAVRDARKREDRAERLRLYYVAMTRAIDRLIVSGAVDRDRTDDEATPIGWVLSRLAVRDELEQAAERPVELERGGARLLLRLDRWQAEPEEEDESSNGAGGAQLELFPLASGAVPPPAPTLPRLDPVLAPSGHRVRRLSYSALALYDRCSYRFYAERIAGLRPTDARGGLADHAGLAATEIGDAVHALLEHVELASPGTPDRGTVSAVVLGRYPEASEVELERIRDLVAAFCESELATRIASLPGAAAERPFAFEHDGVLLHGRIDVLYRADGSALVVDYKTNSLAEGTPEELVQAHYGLQRLVYALVCFRAGARDVEVVYQFLEQPEALVVRSFSLADVPALEAALSEAIARIQGGEFVPTPSEFICAGCPVLDVVCAGPRLRGVEARDPGGALALAT